MPSHAASTVSMTQPWVGKGFDKRREKLKQVAQFSREGGITRV
jgi:hypothetical protein